MPLSEAANSYWSNPGANQPKLYASYIVRLANELGEDPRLFFNQLVRAQEKCSSSLFTKLNKEFDRIENIEGEVVQTSLGQVSKRRLLEDTLQNIANEARLTALTAEFFRNTATFLPQAVAKISRPQIASQQPQPSSRTVPNASSPDVLSSAPAAPRLPRPVSPPSTIIVSDNNTAQQEVPLVAVPTVEPLFRLAREHENIAKQKTQIFAQTYSGGSCRFGTC